MTSINKDFIFSDKLFRVHSEMPSRTYFYFFQHQNLRINKKKMIRIIKKIENQKNYRTGSFSSYTSGCNRK
jgi:hypothetical protein